MPKYLVLLAVFFLGTLSLLGRSHADVVYDVTDMYSSTLNPNGVWTYGWVAEASLGSSALTRFELNANATGGHADFNFWHSSSLGTLPFVGKYQNANDSALQSGTVFRANQVALHTGNSGAAAAAAVVRFTAPMAAVYRIDQAIFEYRSDIPGNRIYVYVGGTNVFEETTSSRGTTDSMVVQSFSLAAGEHIDFAVGSRSGQTNSTTTQLNAIVTQVTAVPEPSTILCFTLVSCAIARYRCRRANNGRFMDHFRRHLV